MEFVILFFLTIGALIREALDGKKARDYTVQQLRLEVQRDQDREQREDDKE